MRPLLLAFLVGCASAPVSGSFRAPETREYPPTNPDSVAFYDAARPAPKKPFERVAQIDVYGDKATDIERDLRRDAARFGAHAVVLQGWEVNATSYRATAIAIRWLPQSN